MCHKSFNTFMNIKSLVKQWTLQVLGRFYSLWKLLVTEVCFWDYVEIKQGKNA